MLKSIYFDRLNNTVFKNLIISLLLFICVNAKTKEKIKNNENQQPECVYIDPIAEMKRWDEFDFSKCQIINYKPLNNESESSDIYYFGEKHYSYNAYVSNMIGARRDLSYIKTHERYFKNI